MAWKVKAVPHAGSEGFRRSGRFFSSKQWTTLKDDEMTDAIRSEPQLLVEPADKKTGLAALEEMEAGVEELKILLGEAGRKIEEQALQLQGKDAQIAALQAQVLALTGAAPQEAGDAVPHGS